MTRQELIQSIRNQKSVLCVGLDTDINRIPECIKNQSDTPVIEFNRRIIDATADHCIAYKFNIAFYESRGKEGWEELEASLEYVPDHIFTIADAKRGDIGNTSQMYAKTFFETFDFDAITVAPYMGMDSLKPFYAYPGKWVVVLALTSNAGSADFQMLETGAGKKLYERVLSKVAEEGNIENTMFVVGATNAEYLRSVRAIVPDHFLLIPGIGKQGGDLKETMTLGLNNEFGVMINSSRGIIYASEGDDFDMEARRECQRLNQQIRPFLRQI